MTDALRMAGFSVAAALMAFTLRAIHRQAGMAVALAAGEGTLASAQYGMRCAERFLSQQIQEEEQ